MAGKRPLCGLETLAARGTATGSPWRLGAPIRLRVPGHRATLGGQETLVHKVFLVADNLGCNLLWATSKPWLPCYLVQPRSPGRMGSSAMAESSTLCSQLWWFLARSRASNMLSTKAKSSL
ncbi:hypothetical protein BHE74_00030197 [Ensete ventricosum]|nr:hypothetical protein BHE74_00030197 [Ensete ventricosum]RZR89894.1 hypothetical protein BHM03_00017700 [Ensete ventricosum]